jgi:hypothetical protein
MKHDTIEARDLPALVRSTWTEAQFNREFYKLASPLGWKCAHFRKARTKKGWRTAVEGDGAGFPDWILVRPYRVGRGTNHVIVAELKVGRNKLTVAQHRWLEAFMEVGIPAYCWTPDDWDKIVEVLS